MQGDLKVLKPKLNATSWSPEPGRGSPETASDLLMFGSPPVRARFTRLVTSLILAGLRWYAENTTRELIPMWVAV